MGVRRQYRYQNSPFLEQQEANVFKTVILDGYTVNPGDLSWDAFKKFGELEVHDRCDAAEVPKLLKDAHAALVNKINLTKDLLEEAESLTYVGILATGYDNVSVKAARNHRITVTNIPGYSTFSVAQHAFALLFSLIRAPETHSRAVKEGRWADGPDFTFQLTPQIELSGKTLGIIGFGKIGRAAAKIGDAMGMKIIVSVPRPKNPPPYEGFRWVDKATLFRESDVVSLHCPLTPETENMLDAGAFRLMKQTAYLINTGRGALIDEDALKNALTERQIAGAGLDVLKEEPPPPLHPLFEAPRCVITPHLAWTTKEARQRIIGIAADNLQRFLQGAPVNVING